MSLRTRINGFTAWVNLRLSPSGHFMHNILTDLLKGYNMKVLLESLTGKPLEKLQSFDGLTQQQKTTRVEWIVKELKHAKIISKDTYVDSRMFAMRCADQVFDLLWCLVCHDIWFVWERSEFLQQAEGQTLTSKPFSWTPPPPPPKTPTHKVEKSMLAGFGSKSLIQTPIGTPELPSPSPTSTSRSDDMVTKRRRSKNFPSPEYCILDMVNAHLKMNREGRKLTRGVLSLSDLTDSRVLCALVNSFVPETFTTEVLLNDRWTINLALTTANQMFKSSNPFDSQDLVEGDIMSVCCYFGFFFMSGYKYRQSRVALKRLDELNVLKIGIKDEMEQFPSLITNVKDLKRKKELENLISVYDEEIQFLEQNYDIVKCNIWMRQVAEIQNKVKKTGGLLLRFIGLSFISINSTLRRFVYTSLQCRAIVAEKIVQRFDVVKVPRNVTINDLAVDLIINLSLTCGTGFYSSKVHETVWKGRKLVLRDKGTGEFFDDFSGNADQKETVRQMLGLEEEQVAEISGDNSKYEIYFESSSRNKTLKAGSWFLYQIFPGTTLQCQRLLFKAAKTGELDTVQKLQQISERIFFETIRQSLQDSTHSSSDITSDVCFPFSAPKRLNRKLSLSRVIKRPPAGRAGESTVKPSVYS
ncbi:unnamed protein product [Porites evermanni]|uniref:Calponin-homology (CH) domain-containing protein n=1 Tax=Porites evermanni TaxID=104178 RepID=A0ABN8SL85_9CNID|nr:unnamed protein product [Porites evermanni]